LGTGAIIELPPKFPNGGVSSGAPNQHSPVRPAAAAADRTASKNFRPSASTVTDDENVATGFLGTGTIIDQSSYLNSVASSPSFSPAEMGTDGFRAAVSKGLLFATSNAGRRVDAPKGSISVPPKFTNEYEIQNNNKMLSVSAAENLPVVTAVSPDSPAERGGLVVGDRLLAVGSRKFSGNREAVAQTMQIYTRREQSYGWPSFTVARPVPGPASTTLGYRLSRVTVPTENSDPFRLLAGAGTAAVGPGRYPTLVGGNRVCHYELLSHETSIFESFAEVPDEKIGYVRLTRFSRSSTAGFVEAVKALENGGASAYIIDVRNNYGGVIQEAMLTASSLLRDPMTVLCYTLNNRGGFTPHDAEEYIVDSRYPGYLLSSEPPSVVKDLVRKRDPAIFTEGWLPPSSYASLHEQKLKGKIPDRRADGASSDIPANFARKQKKIVILVNEGTASSAEVFASSLRDNGRSVALVGTKTYGKGLIQHTFKMDDGGGLRITVAEYLTPALQHVTKVGGAQFDRDTGDYVGGGITPDIQCESKGIPSNPGADLCVGIALDSIDNMMN